MKDGLCWNGPRACFIGASKTQLLHRESCRPAPWYLLRPAKDFELSSRSQMTPSGSYLIAEFRRNPNHCGPRFAVRRSELSRYGDAQCLRNY